MIKEREVIRYIDPELAKQYQRKDKRKKSLKDMTDIEKKEYRRQEEEGQRGLSRNSLRNMGFSSALDKDERVFRLVSALRKKEIQTVQAAASHMVLSENTIRSYLKEANIGVYDAKIGDYLRFNESTEIIEFDFSLV